MLTLRVPKDEFEWRLSALGFDLDDLLNVFGQEVLGRDTVHELRHCLVSGAHYLVELGLDKLKVFSGLLQHLPGI